MHFPNQDTSQGLKGVHIRGVPEFTLCHIPVLVFLLQESNTAICRPSW